MRNPNHPKKGSSIKVEPIRQKAAIERIKGRLLHEGKLRDHCLFTLGVNTAYRANELLSLQVGQVAHLMVGDELSLKQSKNKKYRTVKLRRVSVDAIRLYLENDPRMQGLPPEAPLFYSQKGTVLTVPSVVKMVKKWCDEAGCKGNYGSHTMRKTWGYWQRKRGMKVEVLMEAFGHATQRQTLAYLCIQPEEVADLYDMEL